MKSLWIPRTLLLLAALWLMGGAALSQSRWDGGLVEPTVYYLVYCFGGFFLALALLLPLAAWVYRRLLLFRILSWAVGVFAAVILGTALLVHCFWFFVPKAAGNERFVIVLGAPVLEDTASSNLEARAKAAAEWLAEHPQAKAILSGGNGQPRTEAEVMQTLLMEAGIAEDRLLPETQAATTEENFLFSRDILEEFGYSPEEPLAVVSSEFHFFRLRHLANQIGFTNLRYIPAETPLTVHSGWFARETLLIIRDILIPGLKNLIIR